MAWNGSFQVIISGGSTSVEDYRRAMTAPKSDLPELSDAQKFVVKKLGMPAEEYQRGVLADQMGEDRMVAKGRALGTATQKILDEAGGGYRVDALKTDLQTYCWLVRIVGADREDVVAEVPYNVANDVLDSGSAESVSRLRSYVFKSVRHEQVGEGKEI